MRWIYIIVLVVSALNVHGDIRVKLIGGLTEREGNVDIFIAGKWGMFCDQDFHHVHAEVICRMLGYQRGLAVCDGPFAEGNNTSYWLIKARCNGAEDTLSNCKLREVGYSSSCAFNAGVICGELDIQVKLIGGLTEREGNVDIFIAGKWGMICDYDFHHVHAEVICRMLGYQRGLTVLDGPFAEGNNTSYWWIETRCNGTEDTLSNCKLSSVGYFALCSFTAGVICGEPDIQVKLIGGRTKREGNVDICITGACGIFCDYSFGHVHTEVICRMLGYQRGIAVRNGPFVEGNNTSYWRIKARCDGVEDTLLNCKVREVGYSSSCDFNAGVICGEPDIQVKLIGGRTEREGNVDIFLAGRWGMFCDNGFDNAFDNAHAEVICRMLGYQRGITVLDGPFADGNNTSYWWIDARCNGAEATLSDCILIAHWYSSLCSFKAGVICGEPDIQVRLVGGRKENEGNIDILIAGRWRSFCPNSFEHDETAVICRMLGHQRGIAITDGPFLVRRTITYSWGISSRCNGTEATISDCKLSVWGLSSCEDNAGVICGEPDIKVSLLGERRKGEGNIGIGIAGRLGMLCDNDFDHVQAVVICRMLGYQRGIAITNGPFIERRNSKDNWQIISSCNGTEATILNCKLHVWWQPSSCIKNAGVICGEPDLQVRLVGGWTKNEGNIDISISGRWGRFCPQSFDHTQADVICRMLGHERGIAIINGPFLDERKTLSHWYIRSRCEGREAAISDCQLRFWWQSSLCKIKAGVICGEPDIFPDIRLVGGNSENEGRVEININGRWGTICAELFDRKDAKVLCRFLSQPQSLVSVVNNEQFGKGNTSMEWKIHPNCHGNETSLSECPIGVISSNFKCVKPQAGLLCRNEPDVPEKNQSGDHGIELSEVTGGLLGVVSVAVLAFGVFIYCRRRVRETSVTDAQTIQEPRPRPRPRPRRISSSYDEIDDVNVLVNDYDTIGNPDAVYLELIDHYDQLESPDELSIADPNDGYLHPNVHGTGGEVTESGDGDEDSPPNDGYLQPIVHGTCDKSGEATGSGDADEDSPPNDVCSNDDGLVEMDIE